MDPEATQANIIEVTASDEDADQAARIANAVSETFITERAEIERERIANARSRLQEEIDRLESSPSPSATAEIAAIRERLSQLTVSEGSAGADLQLAGRAEVPGSPTSPRPLRNVILALFGSLVLGVLIALARDQLSPRISDPRELGRLLGVRVLAGIPYVRGTKLQRRVRLLSGAEAEAYETLRTSFELMVPPDAHSVVLITGAVHGEGKTTVSSRLGKSLVRAGHRVLLVSADLRVPRLHELFSLELGVGLSDILTEAQWENSDLDAVIGKAIRVVIERSEGDGRHGSLHVITSGSQAKDPGQLIAGPGLPVAIDALHRRDYDYILLDAPPLLGIADATVLAQAGGSHHPGQPARSPDRLPRRRPARAARHHGAAAAGHRGDRSAQRGLSVLPGPPARAHAGTGGLTAAGVSRCAGPRPFPARRRSGRWPGRRRRAGSSGSAGSPGAAAS